MKPIVRTSPETCKFADLLDAALPIVKSGWQSAPLDIVTSQDQMAIKGQARSGDTPSCPLPSKPARTVELEFDDTQSGIELVRPEHIRLRYQRQKTSSAIAALLAAAAQAGAPIAGDNQTLALCTLSERLATSDIPVLIGGPSGTGKEVFARFLHNVSERCGEPFVAVNCAAMPESMLEALLFGHKKGAFTGAGDAAQGLFRAADKGTLLLDEIGEMPLALQAKLLRTLQECEVLPLGATKPVSVDVRIVACTNRDLGAEVAAGRFREDLFYRLNVFPLRLPALQERPADIAPLAFGMLLRHACIKNKPNWISDAALDMLQSHPWPGNVRELENVIRRAILLCGTNPEIGPEHIHFDASVSAAKIVSTPDAPAMPAAPPQPGTASLSDVAFRSQADAITCALAQCGGHRGKTAQRLGISERTLRYRLAAMRENGLLSAGAMQ